MFHVLLLIFDEFFLYYLSQGWILRLRHETNMVIVVIKRLIIPNLD